MPTTSPFVPPMLATAAREPPAGKLWRHEIKFDGFRVQVHIADGTAALLSRNGHDFSRRFRPLLPPVLSFPAQSAIIDAELAACDPDGRSDFVRLMTHGRKAAGLCLWCFDLLMLDGKDLTKRPLWKRRQHLERCTMRMNHHAVRFSASFTNAEGLLREAERRGLEGIVSKRMDSLYASGRSEQWVKVKTTTWRNANRTRWKFFAEREA